MTIVGIAVYFVSIEAEYCDHHALKGVLEERKIKDNLNTFECVMHVDKKIGK
jgi:hypothetical protein